MHDCCPDFRSRIIAPCTKSVKGSLRYIGKSIASSINVSSDAVFAGIDAVGMRGEFGNTEDGGRGRSKDLLCFLRASDGTGTFLFYGNIIL